MPTQTTTPKASAAPDKTAQRFITRAPGGTGERRELLSAPIPDLWNVAHNFAPFDNASRERILDVWHLAHDLKRELETAFDLIEALQKLLREKTAERYIDDLNRETGAES